MDIWDEIKKLTGYQSGNGGVDSYGVDHSGFSTRDELEYQSARLARENQLAENFAKQGIAEENYPQYGTNFWGGSPENNYGFGTSNISQNIQNVTNQLNNSGFNNGANNGQAFANSDYTVNTESLVGKPSSYFQSNNQQQLRMPVGSEQQITMPSYELQQQLQQPPTSAWDKVKNVANNFAGGTEAATVGYATGASLGNFDEAIGTATAAVTGNRKNYTMGRNATRQLQTELEQRYPNIYGGAEILGATLSSKYLSPYLAPVVAGIGYANSRHEIPENIGKNALVSRFTRGIQKIPWLSQDWRNLGQNVANWYLLKKEKEEEK